MWLTFLSLTLFSLLRTALAATADEWRGRSIYQLMTDRFALTDGSTTADCTGDVFCGGSWQGIINELDYIQNMNFTAIWISPVIEQIYGDTWEGEAYHGYWPKNLYVLDPNFGTADDLTNLVTALHERDMYLMVDIVVNHFGNWGDDIDYAQFVPFNNESYFHEACYIDYSTQLNIEQCRLGDEAVPLVDTDTESDYVVSTLESYITEFVSNFSVDGLRIDATKNIRKDFWPGFCDASGVYCQGEVWSNVPSYFCPYQDVMDGLHNYPLKEYATTALSTSSGSLSNLVNILNEVLDQCGDISVLGSFMENHDNLRMANITSDVSRLKNMATLTILSGAGIPITFYGQEQMMTEEHGALWLTGFDTSDGKLYQYFTTLNTFRNHVLNADSSFATATPTFALASDSVMSIRKSNMVVLVTNIGDGSSTRVTSSGWSGNEGLIDVLTCTTYTAGHSGSLSVTMDDGLPLALYPKSGLSKSGICNL
ncbi:glycoside hydrolase family 13 protein [Fistulina hepatica ATCC 64428]|nr:glycoside hydrolase family 13 protein [Fistulina hepatica ATCC 64428]